MRICIDAYHAIGGYGGIHRYTVHLIKGLLKIDSENQYLLFYNSFRRIDNKTLPVFNGKNVTNIICRFPRRLLTRMWDITRFPPIEFLTGKLDVYHSLHFILPPQHQGKSILTIPDNGKALLQTVFVEDVAEGFILAAENPKKSIGQIYNISGEYAVPLTEYVNILSKILKSNPPLAYLESEKLIELYKDSGKLDVPGLKFLSEHMCVDISKIKQDLGYKPSLSLEDLIEKNIKWMITKGLLRAER